MNEKTDPRNKQKANFFSEGKATFSGGWELAGLVTTALAVLGLTGRYGMIEWHSFFLHLVDLYHRTLQLAFGWLFGLVPIHVPPIVYDWSAIYLLFGSAYVLMRKRLDEMKFKKFSHRIANVFLWPLFLLYHFIQSKIEPTNKVVQQQTEVFEKPSDFLSFKNSNPRLYRFTPYRRI